MKALLLLALVWGSLLPAGETVKKAKPQIWPDDGLPRPVITFPDAAGAANVRSYGAKGDGVTDDTEALQKAFNSNNDDHGRLIWFPAGTYLVSKPLICMRDGKPSYGLQLIGEFRDKTIIKLKDSCPGFQDPAKPATFVQFSSNGSVWGNMAHWNSCWNLTIDTGTGNPGTIATNYYASNHGSMRDCTVRSGDGQGVCGINMNGAWPGPCLVADSQVVGFDTGIAVGTREYGVTFRNIVLDRQRKVAFWNHSNMVAIHRLRVRECTGPAVQNLRREWVPGILVLIDSQLNGRGLETPAIDNVESVVWLRGVKSEGYAGVIKGQGPSVVEYTNQPAQGLWEQIPEIHPGLPVRDPPVIPWDPPKEWAMGGDSDATQRAIDSGKTTVCIPYGEYPFNKPVVIRGNVRRIIGMKTNLWNGKEMPKDAPMWIYESTTAPEVEFSFLTCGRLEHRSPKPLVLRTMRGCAYSGNAKGSGPLFIEDVCAGPWDFTNPINVWAWQWNPEVDNYQVKANGGTFWVCGWKTEGNGTQFVLKDSLLELLGAVVYPHNMKDGIPMFHFTDSAAAMLVRYCSYGGAGTPDRVQDVKVIETRGGETRQTKEIEERLFHAYSDTLLAKLMEPIMAERRKATEKDKPAAPLLPPPPKLTLLPDGLARFDAALHERIRTLAKARKGPLFQISAIRSQARLEQADGGDGLVLLVNGSELTWEWKRLDLADRAGLALAISRPNHVGDAAESAFWLLATGQRAEGERQLTFADASGTAAVRAAFSQEPVKVLEAPASAPAVSPTAP